MRHTTAQASFAVALALGLLACSPSPTQGHQTSVQIPQTSNDAPSSDGQPVADDKPAPKKKKVVGTLPVPADLSLSPAGRKAIQTLGKADAFGGWAVGYGGQPVPAVAALRTLLAEPEAARALRVVIAHGTLEGQLMAVSGLYFADPAGFEAALAPYRSMTEPVNIRYNGCIVGHESVTVSEVVEKPNSMKMLGPSDSMEDWSKRNPNQFSVHYDIANGSYPFQLRGRSI